MIRVFFSVSALLLSVAILLTGHGVQLTVAPLYASALGWSASAISYTGSAYFAGFVVGCLSIPRLVAWVGHIRVFAVLTASATAALLILALASWLEVWMLARLVTGWTMAGLYMIIESWLSERTSHESRGLVLSIYTALTLGAIMLGQVLTGYSADFQALITIGAILIALGSIPVGLTRSVAPEPIAVAAFEFMPVYRAGHVAIWGAFVGGLVTSGYWVLGPLVAQRMGLDGSEISLFLAITLIGGAVCQLPVGRLSDRLDRRVVIGGLALIGALVSVIAINLNAVSVTLYVVMFLLGGTIFPLYAICLAHANDNTPLSLIQTGSVVLMIHSLGAVIGPPLLALVMDFSPFGLYFFAAVILGIFGSWALWRAHNHPILRTYFEPYHDVPRTTVEVMELTTDDDSEVVAKPD